MGFDIAGYYFLQLIAYLHYEQSETAYGNGRQPCQIVYIAGPKSGCRTIEIQQGTDPLMILEQKSVTTCL